MESGVEEEGEEERCVVGRIPPFWLLSSRLCQILAFFQAPWISSLGGGGVELFLIHRGGFCSLSFYFSDTHSCGNKGATKFGLFLLVQKAYHSTVPSIWYSRPRLGQVAGQEDKRKVAYMA